MGARTIGERWCGSRIFRVQRWNARTHAPPSAPLPHPPHTLIVNHDIQAIQTISSSDNHFSHRHLSIVKTTAMNVRRNFRNQNWTRCQLSLSALLFCLIVGSNLLVTFPHGFLVEWIGGQVVGVGRRVLCCLFAVNCLNLLAESTCITLTCFLCFCSFCDAFSAF